MNKDTKKNLTIAGLSVATGFFAYSSVRLALHTIDLENTNSWLRKRVDATLEFVNKAQNVTSSEEATALAEKFDTEIKFLDQVHGY